MFRSGGAAYSPPEPRLAFSNGVAMRQVFSAYKQSCLPNDFSGVLFVCDLSPDGRTIAYIANNFGKLTEA